MAIAKGDGPAATAPKTPPAHLTTLSQKNGGKIPANRIAGILRGQATVTAHGNQDMAGLGTGVLANKPGA